VRRVKAQRILLVDDDIETVETLSRYLHLSGLNNSTCYGGLAALSVLSRSSFDVIVLDLRLGDLDGLEVLRRLRSRGLATPVIIVTGFATIRSAVEATKLGADLCEKPVDADDLLTALKRLAETHDIIHRDNPSQCPNSMGRCGYRGDDVARRLADGRNMGAATWDQRRSVARLVSHRRLYAKDIPQFCATNPRVPSRIRAGLST